MASGLGLRFTFSLVLVASLLFGGCFRREEGEQFYGKVSAPSAQVFRWSDGGLPRIFDPARAAAPPDTDAVRALFEGLTEYEPGTLRPAPAVATSWEPSEGGRKWTFHLRADARWSNGDPVTAQDFVRSWRRTLRLGERAPHARLLANIEGAQPTAAASFPTSPGPPNAMRNEAPSAGEAARAERSAAKPEVGAQTPAPAALGVVALDAHTLRVTLQRPDVNFPALVAHPVFRPVHELSPGADLQELQEEQKQDGGGQRELGIITNGAFSLSRLASDGVELERAPGYWDAGSVKLERVRFVGKGDPEASLAAYREGEVDAVTNAAIEPLAVKLLTPYRDFRRETFAALNYYSFNTARAPFDDRRVREALACALDIERLSADTLGGATEPARGFLPNQSDEEESSDGPLAADGGKNAGAESEVKGDAAEPEVKSGAAELAVRPGGAEGGVDASAFVHNVARARSLFAAAGFPGGANFPRIRLLVNRNEQQRIVAQAVARMWHDALGVETDVVVRGWEDYVAMLRAGDYDVARRSLVMQTTDEETNMLELFGDEAPVEESVQTALPPQSSPAASSVGSGAVSAAPATPSSARRDPPILTEAEALRELPAIPIHFASSYALVKPYVNGFASNLLDAPSLKGVSINTDWRPSPETKSARLALGGRR
ncbi:MAG TPA: peptide ABC transporter substrate-binding protein [Pyrinomonadaceae bacterium]|nr:peptide ABC transporter substrate-binding protein [Pyrinomonadaceae bacterium]